MREEERTGKGKREMAGGVNGGDGVEEIGGGARESCGKISPAPAILSFETISQMVKLGDRGRCLTGRDSSANNLFHTLFTLNAVKTSEPQHMWNFHF